MDNTTLDHGKGTRSATALCILHLVSLSYIPALGIEFQVANFALIVQFLASVVVIAHSGTSMINRSVAAVAFLGVLGFTTGLYNGLSGRDVTNAIFILVNAVTLMALLNCTQGEDRIRIFDSYAKSVSLFMSIIIFSFLTYEAPLVRGAFGLARLGASVPSIHPNAVGVFAMILLASGLRLGGWPSQNRILKFQTVLGLVGLLWSQYRTGILFLAIVLAIIGIRNLRNSPGLASMTILLYGSGAAIAGPTIWQVVERQENAARVGQLSGRSGAWDRALELIYERPWTGWGFEPLTNFEIGLGNAHNSWLQALLLYGLPGLLLVLLLLYFSRPTRSSTFLHWTLFVLIVIRSIFNTSFESKNYSFGLLVFALVPAALASGSHRRLEIELADQGTNNLSSTVRHRRSAAI